MINDNKELEESKTRLKILYSKKQQQSLKSEPTFVRKARNVLNM